MQQILTYIYPKSVCGFIPLHAYSTKAIKSNNEKGKKGVVLTSNFDETEGVTVNLYMEFSNKQSLDKYFRKDELSCLANL